MTNSKLSSATEKLIADREVGLATIKQYLTVQTEGKRKVEHQFGYYRSFAKDGETDNSVIKKYLTTASNGKQYKAMVSVFCVQLSFGEGK